MARPDKLWHKKRIINSSSFVQGKNWIMFWFIILKRKFKSFTAIAVYLCVFGSIDLWRFVSRDWCIYWIKAWCWGKKNNAWTKKENDVPHKSIEAWEGRRDLERGIMLPRLYSWCSGASASESLFPWLHTHPLPHTSDLPGVSVGLFVRLNVTAENPEPVCIISDISFLFLLLNHNP